MLAQLWSADAPFIHGMYKVVRVPSPRFNPGAPKIVEEFQLFKREAEDLSEILKSQEASNSFVEYEVLQDDNDHFWNEQGLLQHK